MTGLGGTDLLFVLLGLVVGLFAGLLGVGGGWLLAPTLNIMGFPALTAVGTSLTQMVGTSLFGVYRHKKKGGLDLKLAAVVSVPFIAGVHTGLLVLQQLNANGAASLFLRYGHLALTLSIGTSMLFETRRKKKSAAESRSWRTAYLGPSLAVKSREIPILIPIICGFLAGFLSGILGIGGGVVLVPMMIYLMGLSIVEAVATNLVCIVIGSLSGAISYGLKGQVAFDIALLIIVGSYAGTWLGTNLIHASNPVVVRRIFSYLMMTMAVAISVSLAGYERFAQVAIFTGAFTLGISAIVHTRRYAKSYRAPLD